MQATILVSGAGGVRYTPRIAASPMAPHAVRLLVGLDGDVGVDSAGLAWRGRVVAIAPDRTHVATSEGPAVCFLFDPEFTGARGLVDGGAAAVLDGRVGEAVLALVGARGASIARADVLERVLDDVVALLPSELPRFDRRVARALDIWRARTGELPTVDDVAARVGLSKAHFRDLFTSAIGIPPRHYRTWTLLSRAFRAPHPRSVTELAHEAGFADLAHFARTCRTILGVNAIGNHLRAMAPVARALRADENPRFVQAAAEATT